MSDFFFMKTTLDILDVIQQKQGVMMAKIDQTQALIVALQGAANAIAAKIQQLQDQISGGLSATEADQVNAELTTLKGQLEALGAPVP